MNEFDRIINRLYACRLVNIDISDIEENSVSDLYKSEAWRKYRVVIDRSHYEEKLYDEFIDRLREKLTQLDKNGKQSRVPPKLRAYAVTDSEHYYRAIAWNERYSR